MNISKHINYRGDGILHINIHRYATTELGRMLDNSQCMSFFHARFGNFKTVNAMVLWAELRDIPDVNHEKLRTVESDEECQALLEEVGLDFKATLVCAHHNHRPAVQEAIIAKLHQNEALLNALKESTLPLYSYAVYGKSERNRKAKCVNPILDYCDFLMMLRDNFKLSDSVS